MITCVKLAGTYHFLDYDLTDIRLDHIQFEGEIDLIIRLIPKEYRLEWLILNNKEIQRKGKFKFDFL